MAQRGDGRYPARREPDPDLDDEDEDDEGPPEQPTQVMPLELNPALVNVWEPDGVVASRYRVKQTLGKGGMGAVILAEDLFLRHDVAIKTLHASIASDPEALDAFRQEVSLAHAVTHPNLARTFDMGEAGGVTFLTMEYLRGISLKQRIEQGPLPVPEALQIARQVAEAMNASHRAGVVHRDLKPANIQLTPERGAVVMDFGLAAGSTHRSASLSETEGRSGYLAPSTSSAGTPMYMAPEQWRCEPQGPAVDIYAMGCILFEMLTGRIPFQADTRAAMRAAHLDATPPSIRSLRGGVPAALDQLVQACLAKDPARRPGSMAEVLRRLTPTSIVPHVITLALAIGSAALVVVAGFSLWHVTKALLISQMKPAARSLAEQLAARVDLEDLHQVRAPADIETEPFQRNLKQIRELRKEYPEIRYAYTMRMVKPPSGWVFVVDADPRDQDTNGDGEVSDEEKGSPPGLPYDGSLYAGLQRVWKTRQPAAEDDIRRDAWGIFFSGYAPIRPGPGSKFETEEFYVAGIDLYNSPLVRLEFALKVVFAALTLMTLGGVILLRLRRQREQRVAPAS